MGDWKDVLEVILKNMPLALWWDGVYPLLPGQSSGLVLQPMTGLPNPQQYLEPQAPDSSGYGRCGWVWLRGGKKRN